MVVTRRQDTVAGTTTTETVAVLGTRHHDMVAGTTIMAGTARQVIPHRGTVAATITTEAAGGGIRHLVTEAVGIIMDTNSEVEPDGS